MKIGYARVSTRTQKLAPQINALNEAGCDKIYKECLSGVIRKNSVLTELVRILKEGDELVVTRLDRLGRSLRHFLSLTETLKEKGIKLKVLHENIDTDTAHGQFVMNLFAMLAELEREWIRDRTRKGLAVAKASGKKSGRKPGKYKGICDPRTARNRKMALHMKEKEKMSYKEICEHFNITMNTAYTWVYLQKRLEAKEEKERLKKLNIQPNSMKEPLNNSESE